MGFVRAPCLHQGTVRAVFPSLSLPLACWDIPLWKRAARTYCKWQMSLPALVAALTKQWHHLTFFCIRMWCVYYLRTTYNYTLSSPCSTVHIKVHSLRMCLWVFVEAAITDVNKFSCHTVHIKCISLSVKFELISFLSPPLRHCRQQSLHELKSSAQKVHDLLIHPSGSARYTS